MRYDYGQRPLIADVARRNLGRAVTQLDPDHAISRPDRHPNQVAELARRRRERQGCCRRMESLEMTAEPGKAFPPLPPSSANRLDQPDRPYAGHEAKYYIVSDLSRERRHAEPLSRPCPRHSGGDWRVHPYDHEGSHPRAHVTGAGRTIRNEPGCAAEHRGNPWRSARPPAQPRRMPDLAPGHAAGSPTQTQVSPVRRDRGPRPWR